MLMLVGLVSAGATFASPPQPGDEGVFHGPLISVIDGDSLKVKVQGVVMDFRLAEVDAPELDQPYGSTAKRELLALVRDRYLVLKPFETDRYGRTVAHVWVDDMQINREMVSRGAAWFYSKYAMSNELYNVELDARDARRGLWKLPVEDRIQPWEWREKKRDKAAARKQKKKT